MDDWRNRASEWERRIRPFDEAAAEECRRRWDSIAKPRGSLGRLERTVERIAGFTGDPRYAIDGRTLVVLCADNGVSARGVSPVGGEVTAILAGNLARGDVTVCKMAALARADVVAVDMGMFNDLKLPGFLDRRLAAGTDDISVGPALTCEQALRGVEYGIGLAETLADKGRRLLLTGEIGIGNTTTAGAMAAVFLGLAPALVAGRGAGLPPERIGYKAEVIEKAIAVNRPDPGDALDVLAKLGGFDIAGMAGVFIGGAMRGVPVLVDGVISSVAALAALRLCPASGRAMLASHVSAEPAGVLVLEALGLEPLICADMCLGEGTGAVAALPLLDMAYAVYTDMITYEDMAIGRCQ